MTTLFYLFLVLLGLLGGAFYLAIFVLHVPGFAEERFGKLEPLPPDLGKWRPDTESNEARTAESDGLRREVRHWFDSDKKRLYLQARYRSVETSQVVRSDPDVLVKRKRVRV